MPIITLEGGKLTKEQKKELVHKLTQTVSEISKVPKQFFTVVIREHDDENIGVAGETVAEIKKKQ